MSLLSKLSDCIGTPRHVGHPGVCRGGIQGGGLKFLDLCFRRDHG